MTREHDVPFPPVAGTCPVCGVGPLQEVRCKVICANCRTILQSCADLSVPA